MKTSTKSTLIELATLAWVAGVSAFYMWSYKQDQIDVLKAEHHGELKAKEHELDRAKALSDAKQVSLNYMRKNAEKDQSCNEELTNALQDATKLVKKQREHIEELRARLVEMKKTSVMKITVSAKDLRSAKKARKFIEQCLAEGVSKPGGCA